MKKVKIIFHNSPSGVAVAIGDGVSGKVFSFQLLMLVAFPLPSKSCTTVVGNLNTILADDDES